MDIPTPTFEQVLRDSPEDLTGHLFVNDPDESTGLTLASFVEPAFDGYLPKPADVWSAATPSLLPGTVTREMLLAFLNHGATAVDVRGWFLTLETSEGTALFAWGFLDQPVRVAAGAIVVVRAAIEVAPREDVPGTLLFTRSVALAFFGGLDQMRVKGKERQILIDARKALDQITRRDSEIASLSARSKRSRVRVVPTDDAPLIEHFNAVAARVDAMLAL